jgi:AcrR family transcriptional regulator
VATVSGVDSPTRRRRSPHALPPGRHGLPHSFVASNQRERLLEAVASVTARLGYADTTVRDIHTAAGVSRKTFYAHFDNKEDVFLAAYDEVSTMLLAHVEAELGPARTFEEGVTGCLRAFLEFIANEPTFAQMCIVEVLSAGPDLLERRNKTMRAFAELVERGAALGVPGATPPTLTAQTIVGGIYEVVYSRLVENRVSELPELLPDLAFAVMLPYAGATRARKALQTANRRA